MVFSLARVAVLSEHAKSFSQVETPLILSSDSPKKALTFKRQTRSCCQILSGWMKLFHATLASSDLCLSSSALHCRCTW